MTLNLQHQIEKKILDGTRLSQEDGLYLLKEAPLVWLGRLANDFRNKKVQSQAVTFIIDSNPNYTNICDTYCQFCAFYRRPGDKDAYTLTVPQVLERIDRVQKLGATTVLLQGGHNRDLPLDFYVDLVKKTKEKYPHVTPHFFTASEIQTIAEVSNLTISQVLSKLKEAGQHTLPGGGAEILSDRVRKRLAPKKGGAGSWLEVHREAHKLGFASTATMMYGHVEEPEDIVEHWDHIRRLQDESLARKNKGGFTAFIPWSFKPDNTVLQKKFPRRVGPVPYLRILAASRIFLDNFDHVQASWFSEGKKTGQAALQFGCDDFGGTLYEENVHAEAGFVNTITLQEMVTLIHEAGFDAVQRTTRYEKLKAYPRKKNGTATPNADEISLRKGKPTEAAKV